MNEHEIKEKILDIIRKSPNVSTDDISKKISIDVVDTVLFLRELESEGKIKRIGE